MKFHEDKSTPGPLEIFVFGSNLAGRHGRGAAHAARLYYDAVYGVGEGPTGRTYAIPTLDSRFQKRSLKDIKISIDKFIEYVIQNPHKDFFITMIGCGLANFKSSEIAPMFISLKDKTNVSFPKPWKTYLTI